MVSKKPKNGRNFAYSITTSMTKKKKRMVLWIVLGFVALIAATALIIVNRPNFGRNPRGERLERIHRSPNYRDGAFRNRHETPLLTSDKSRVSTMLRFLTGDKTGLRPENPIPVVRTDLKTLSPDSNLVVWFGHSSYYMQADGKRVLVDPVFCAAAPFAWLNKPFAGTEIYRPEDIPQIDFLVITHDHWDHLDYATVTQLRERIGHVVCPLGVGEHFERWGFDPGRLIELDWDEQASPQPGFTFHCLPARHFSGRGPRANQTLWASFLLESPSLKLFMGGDGGYDTHFAQIGQAFAEIDLAVLENGQYNADWRYIHTMPEQLDSIARDLKARRILTVHHSKYALARHPWQEPLENEQQLLRDSLPVVIPRIGEVVPIR